MSWLHPETTRRAMPDADARRNVFYKKSTYQQLPLVRYIYVLCMSCNYVRNARCGRATRYSLKHGGQQVR
eukprot:674623-Pleurochrysis_carterae.AAC.1